MLKAKAQRTIGLKNEKTLKQAAVAVIVALMSVAATQSRILGYLSPINVVIAAVSGSCGVFAFAASFVTYFVTGHVWDGIVQITSMILILGVKFLRNEIGSQKKKAELSSAFLTSGAMLFTSVIVSVVSRTDAHLTAFRLMFSILCGCVVYFAESSKNRAGADGILDINGINGASVGILYVVAIATLSSTQILGFNIGRIIGVAVILFAASKYKHIGGAVCGALTTCGVILYSPELAKNTLLLASCGLLCGALSSFGSVFSALVFMVSSVISLMAVGFNNDTFGMLSDCAVGAVIFAAVPPEACRNLFKALGGKLNAVDIVGQTASSRLKFTSGTLKDVRLRLSSISETLDKNVKIPPASHRVRSEVCESCPVNDVCWNDNRKKLASVFHTLEEAAEEKGSLEKEDVLEIFPICRRASKLSEGFNKYVEQLVCQRSENQKNSELREMLSEQLLAMEDLLTDLSYNVEKITEVDASLSVKVKNYLAKQGISGARACVYCGENRSRKIEVFSPVEIKADLMKITLEIGNITNCELELPVVSQVEGMNRLIFCERPVYDVKSGISQLSSKDGDYCGDTLERIWLSKSEYAVILSDGMGTGKRAKLDSSFAVTLVSRFVASGISPETSLHLINSILRVKGWDESFATADIVLFDLCAGKAKFVKAGAAPSYILRDEVLVKIDGQAFPLGILSETVPVCADYKLFDGDRVIIISDGISEKILKAAVKKMNSYDFNASQAAELISGLAESPSGKEGELSRKDDISVCVLDVCMNN